MLLEVPEVLTREELRICRAALAAARWVDGNVTAGHQSRQVKYNTQLAEDSDAARALGHLVHRALSRNLLFLSAALPARIYPPLFNRYGVGDAFGTHVDNAFRQPHDGGPRLRTDLSATLFLADPDEYDGGELVIEDTCGSRAVKLPAGHLVLYPATSLHRVDPVTRGTRLASFLWVQSLIPEDAQRTLLFDLDMAIVRLRDRLGEADELVALTGVYHNLLRRWGHP